MREVVLYGCQTRPASSYLKALAVIRLVAEQVDNKARAWWRDDCFVLDSDFGEKDLVDFFVHRYSPTPMVAPWNLGSGFYDGDATEGLDAIMSSSTPRFEAYRKAVCEVRSWPEMPKDQSMGLRARPGRRGGSVKLGMQEKLSRETLLRCFSVHRRVLRCRLCIEPS